jgi:hypothetical protein
MSTFTRTGHVHQDALALQAVDDLPRQETETVQRHLSFCVPCRARLKEMESVVAALRMLARTPAEPPPRHQGVLQ